MGHCGVPHIRSPFCAPTVYHRQKKNPVKRHHQIKQELIPKAYREPVGYPLDTSSLLGRPQQDPGQQHKRLSPVRREASDVRVLRCFILARTSCTSGIRGPQPVPIITMPVLPKSYQTGSGLPAAAPSLKRKRCLQVEKSKVWIYIKTDMTHAHGHIYSCIHVYTYPSMNLSLRVYT